MTILREHIMAVYFLIEITEIHDPDQYAQYVEKAAPIVARYGGQYIVRSNRLTPLSGTWQAQRIILIRFESHAQIERCFSSTAYKQIAPLREQSTRSKTLLIED